MRNLTIVMFIFLITTFCFADVTLTDEEYKFIKETLVQDKQIIQLYSTRYTKLRKETPIISYKINDNKTVTQTITIPVYKDNPLEYKVEFTITDAPLPVESYVPLKLMLCPTVEYSAVSGMCLDVKGGIKVFSLQSFYYTSLKPIGLNILVGGRSAGISLSYTLLQLLPNTSIHTYIGLNYQTSQKVFGLGISLYF